MVLLLVYKLPYLVLNLSTQVLLHPQPPTEWNTNTACASMHTVISRFPVLTRVGTSMADPYYLWESSLLASSPQCPSPQEAFIPLSSVYCMISWNCSIETPLGREEKERHQQVRVCDSKIGPAVGRGRGFRLTSCAWGACVLPFCLWSGPLFKVRRVHCSWDLFHFSGGHGPEQYSAK